MTTVEFPAQWIVRSSLLIAGGSLLLWLLKAKDASLRSVAWTAMLCASLAIPILTFNFPKTFLPTLRRTAAGVVIRPADVPVAVSQNPRAIPTREPAVKIPPASVYAGKTAPVSSAPFDRPGASDRTWTINWPLATLLFYAVICGVMLVRLFGGLWASSRLRGRSNPTGEVTQGIEIRESAELTAPATMGIVRPVIVLPADWREWNSATRAAVLAHESSHVRRRDLLLQSLSGIHKALLWASPLSWFLHRRIVQTAEEASDDAAVAATNDRVAYAETLFAFMRRDAMKPGLVGVSMARYYGDPQQRIRRILYSTALSRGVTGRSIAAIVALASPLAYVIATGQGQPQFDIADVHVNEATSARQTRGASIRAGLYRMESATMVDLIGAAYSVDAGRVLGGPSWLELDRFDVFAKAAASTKIDEARLMLQSLLADRFKLRLHMDSKPLPGFALTLGKGVTPKLKKAEGSGSAGCKMSLQYTQPEFAARRQALIQAGNTKPVLLQIYLFQCQNVTMKDFAEALRSMPDGQKRFDNVKDQTGLSGAWDFNFKYSSQPPPAAAESEIDGENITVFDALEKQLGLKLTAAKIPTPVIVVDSLNRQPAENPPDVKTILPPSPPPAFEVADLRLSAPGAPEVSSAGPQPGGRFEVRNYPLSFLIMVGWGLPSNGALAGKPAWLDSVRVDLAAKLPSTDATRAVTGTADMDVFAPALRALLIERFKISIHTEVRPVPGYALVAAKPKIKNADPSLRTKCFEGPGADGKDPRAANALLSRLITCQNITMEEFAKRLPALAGAQFRNQVVVDSSGLQGRYDLTISFSATAEAERKALAGGPGGLADMPVADGGITLSEALDKQLGLKLEKRNIPVPVVILDHIEQKPAEN